MKLVWSPETASDAYIQTVQSCENSTETGVAELLSATAAGWTAQVIVESWSSGNPIFTSIGLAVAAHLTHGRHVCIVPNENSKSDYTTRMKQSACLHMPEIIVGELERTVPDLSDVDFLVLDSNYKGFREVFRLAKLSRNGAVLICKNAMDNIVSGFDWRAVVSKETRVVRSEFLPVGKGLDMAHVSYCCVGAVSKKSPSRWITLVDKRSGDEHVFRG